MQKLPPQRYTAAEVRAMDRHLIESLGIPGYELMCRAGEQAFVLLRALWPGAHRVLILCGSGNNGGDGYVLARLAGNAGLDVSVAAMVDPYRLKGDARRAYEECVAAGVQVGEFTPRRLGDADVVVDAIFGIGLDRPLDAAVRACIEDLNASGKPVLAIDIPSGIHADTGAVMGAAVRASATISFIGLKRGCFIGEGPAHAGRMHFSSLGDRQDFTMAPEKNEADGLRPSDRPGSRVPR